MEDRIKHKHLQVGNLKDSGSGNQNNFLSGFAYTFGDFQIAPNFLWQKPIVAAMPNDLNGGTGRLRNVQDDPFAVRANRETTAGELLFILRSYSRNMDVRMGQRPS